MGIGTTLRRQPYVLLSVTQSGLATYAASAPEVRTGPPLNHPFFFWIERIQWCSGMPARNHWCSLGFVLESTPVGEQPCSSQKQRQRQNAEQHQLEIVNLMQLEVDAVIGGIASKCIYRIFGV